MSISDPRRKERSREGTARFNHLAKLIDELRADFTASKEEMNRRIDRLQIALYSGSVGKDSDTHEIVTYRYGWRRRFGTFLWTLATVGLIIGCAWNFRELLQDMMESPTVTKMTSPFHDKLSLPPISVYQSNDYPMLHTEKLFRALENGSLTEAYLEVIIKGIGIRFFLEQNITFQRSDTIEAYKKAILQYGSLTEAALAFQKEYGVVCDELFTYCGEAMAPPMNCCDVFEHLWGLQGLQYALKWNTIFLDAFRGFFVTLRSLPSIKALQEGDFIQEPGNYQSYWIGISNGVDQTGYDAHTIQVQPSEIISILLRQKRRNIKIYKDCIDPAPKLRYFRNYTITNCIVEQCYIDKLPLCNISCEIPLLPLLNPKNLSSPPCGLDVYNPMCRDIIQANQLQCSTNHGCRFPCNHTEIEYSVTKGLGSGGQRESELYFKYETTEVQTFEETSRLTLWEYLGLISSVLDLWLGITIYSLFRMLFRFLSKITYLGPYGFGKDNSNAAHIASTYQQHEMTNND